MNEQSLEMYKFNKKMNFDIMCDSAKLTHKMELSRFNILADNYIDFDDSYFLTCSVKKWGENYQRCSFWLKRETMLVTDIITDFDITIPNYKKDKIKMFKANKKFKPIKINKWEDDDFIYFELVVITFDYALFIKPKIILDIECNICYETGNKYYIEKPFMCNHNEVCVGCVNKIFKTSNVCCICRANKY
jgi:hypothetical protein